MAVGADINREKEQQPSHQQHQQQQQYQQHHQLQQHHQQLQQQHQQPQLRQQDLVSTTPSYIVTITNQDGPANSDLANWLRSEDHASSPKYGSKHPSKPQSSLGIHTACTAINASTHEGLTYDNGCHGNAQWSKNSLKHQYHSSPPQPIRNGKELFTGSSHTISSFPARIKRAMPKLVESLPSVTRPSSTAKCRNGTALPVSDNIIYILVLSIAILFILVTASLGIVWILRNELIDLESKLDRKCGCPPGDVTNDESQRGLRDKMPHNHLRYHDDDDDDDVNSFPPKVPVDYVMALDDLSDGDLSRHARNALRSPGPEQEEREVMTERPTKRPRRKGRKERKGKGKNLRVEHYTATWTSKFNPDKGNCGPKQTLLGTPTTCRSKSVIMEDKESIIGFYEKSNSSRKKKRLLDLLHLNSNSGRFTVKTAGVYLLHLNITITDNAKATHSVGIFLNGAVLFACQPGGIRCSHTNEPNSARFRLCTAHGVAMLKTNDVIDIRTMSTMTTIKLKLKSHFWAILMANDA